MRLIPRIIILSILRGTQNDFSTTFLSLAPAPLWHGIDVGPNPPKVVHAYVEITSFDLVKYEVDKVTGYLQVDRPQRSSSQPPTFEDYNQMFG